MPTKNKKFVAISSYADRTRGLKWVFEKMDAGEFDQETPLLENNQAIFCHKPSRTERDKQEAEGYTVSVNPDYVRNFIKRVYVDQKGLELWEWYLLTDNPYFLYDIVCLYKYAKIETPPNLTKECMNYFSEMAEMALFEENKKKEILSLFGLQSQSKGQNVLWNEYKNFLSDLVIYDVVKELMDEDPSAKKDFIFARAKEVLEETVTTSDFEVAAVDARHSSISDIRRTYEKVHKLKMAQPTDN